MFAFLFHKLFIVESIPKCMPTLYKLLKGTRMTMNLRSDTREIVDNPSIRIRNWSIHFRYTIFFWIVCARCHNHKSPIFTTLIFQSWTYENKRMARASSTYTNYKNNISSSPFFRQCVQQNNSGINFRFISRSRLSFFSCDLLRTHISHKWWFLFYFSIRYLLFNQKRYWILYYIRANNTGSDLFDPGIRSFE